MVQICHISQLFFNLNSRIFSDMHIGNLYLHRGNKDDIKQWNDSAIRWIDTLQIGCIINAKDDRDTWYEAVVRYKKDRKVCIHFIGWNIKWDAFFDCDKEDDLHGLSPRYVNCEEPHRATKGRHAVIMNYISQKMISMFGDTLTLRWST